MSFTHALVFGASGGIGQAFARQLAAHPTVQTLVLCARAASTDPALAEIAALGESTSRRCWRIDADITDEASLRALAAQLSAQVPSLDLIINASGLLHADGVAPEKSLEQIALPAMQQVFAVNAYGPILLAQALMPWLRARQRVVFASLSAKVGSIADNRLGGWYSYRAAKAAQNQLLKTLAIELGRKNPESVVLALHPGTTDTALSRPFQGNVAPGKLFSPAWVADALLAIIARATPEDSGQFLSWDGERLPW